MNQRLTFLIRDLGYGGAQRQLAALAKGMAAEGCAVSVVSFYGGPLAADLESSSVNVVTIGKKGRWDMLGFVWRIIRTLRVLRPEVLHTYLSESNLLGALLKPLLPKTRLVWGLRDSQTDAALYGWLGRLAFGLARRLARVPDLLIANSQSGADYYADQGYPRERMVVIPNGIDVNRFKPDASEREALRQEWGIPAGAFVFGLVGRMSPMKDMITAVRAMKRMPPHVHLVIMGGGDAAYEQSIREQADARIHFSPPQSDMPKVYAAFDALLNSSAFGEGFSNVIGEAMACGLHCVGTEVGDTAMLIGDTGYTVPPKQPELLAEAMQRLIQNAPGSPRQRVEQHFTIPRMIATTAEALTRRTVAVYTTGLGSGGAEMMLTQMLGKLDRRAFAPHVVSLTEGGKYADTLREMGIPVHCLGMKAGVLRISALWKLRSLASRIRPAVHVGWMYHGNLAASIARLLAHRAPVLWNVRQSLYDLKLEKRGSALVIKLLAWLSWLPKAITYNSKLSAQQHQAIGYRADRTQLTANGFDPERFKPDADARSSVRAELGLSSDAVLVGRFGRYAAMKDYETFLTAAQRLPSLHFMVAGAGTQELDSALQNVIVLGERHDLPRLTAALDVAVSSSAFGEGFPNVIAEAMCASVPVVSTDVGDSAWVMGDLGRLVPPRDPLALANAIRATLDDPNRHISAQAGRERILSEFSLSSVVKQFEAALTDACRSEAQSPSTSDSPAPNTLFPSPHP
jgi:glycosyltransferase involved in cell wall biosynthesis